MSILGKIFSGGATELVKGVGGVIDNLHTSKEEKLEAEKKIKDMIMGYEANMQKQITERWGMDMKSDSWLSKNIRPMTLAFLVISTVLMIFIDAGVISFEVKDTWVDLLQLVLITVIGAYFGGRSLEKVKK
jgi:Ca2+-dependent lipid-binding protein